MVLLLLTVQILTFFALTVHCDTKIWIYTSDIFSPSNWVDGALQKQCEGLVFGQQLEVDLPVDQLRVKRLTLPSDGVIKLDPDSKITFDERSTTKENCIRLKSIKVRPWFDITAWNSTQEPVNPAVPYLDRIPSEYDDVVFPTAYHLATVSLDHEVKVRSLSIHKTRLIYFKGIFDSEGEKLAIRATGLDCKDVTGCVRDDYYYVSICSLLPPITDPPECIDPIIKAQGFCGTPICGALIHITGLKSDFTMARIKQSLKQFNSYTHVSKFQQNHLQITFAEESFTGQSLEDATQFYNTLLEDGSFSVEKAYLKLSGPPLGYGWTRLKSTIYLVLGTLLAVAVTFGLLFVSYSSLTSGLNLRFLGNRPLSAYILRYDNMEDRGYIVDTRSVADLSSAFENPLYHHAPSSENTSNETLTSLKPEETGVDEEENVTDTSIMGSVAEADEDGVEEVLLKEL